MKYLGRTLSAIITYHSKNLHWIGVLRRHDTFFLSMIKTTSKAKTTTQKTPTKIKQTCIMKRLRLSSLKKSMLLMCFLYTLFIFYSYILAQKLKTIKHKLTSEEQIGLAKFHYKPNINTDCSEWYDFITCNKLWHGDPMFPFQLPSDLKLTVLVSLCDENVPLHLFQQYIRFVPKQKIKKIYVRTCPHHSPDHSIAIWLKQNRKRLIASTEEDKHKHFILFMNSPSIKNINQWRRLRDVLQLTILNGFGCVTRPIESHHSIYHSTDVLRSYRSHNKQNNSTFANFGNWLDEINVALDTYTPVCYTSSFAIRAWDVATKSDILLSIYRNLVKHRGSEEVHGFAERTWGGIFSYPLKSNKIAALSNHTYKIISETYGLTGSLVSNYNKHLLPLWRGESWLETSSLRISVVISHCSESLRWVNDFIKDTSIHDLTILSKCNKEVKGLAYKPVAIKKMPMPNSRSLYHPFARYMSQMTTETKDAENHIIVFLSASKIPDYSQTLGRMVTSAANLGYACSYKHNGKLSIFYDTNIIRKSSPKDYSTTFGQWLDENEVMLPNPITPFCHSDHFTTKVSNIIKQKETWEKFRKLETHGVNANFVKQTWAGLLFDPLTEKQLDYFRTTATDAAADGMLTSDF